MKPMHLPRKKAPLRVPSARGQARTARALPRMLPFRMSPPTVHPHQPRQRSPFLSLWIPTSMEKRLTVRRLMACRSRLPPLPHGFHQRPSQPSQNHDYATSKCSSSRLPTRSSLLGGLALGSQPRLQTSGGSWLQRPESSSVVQCAAEDQSGQMITTPRGPAGMEAAEASTETTTICRATCAISDVAGAKKAKSGNAPRGASVEWVATRALIAGETGNASGRETRRSRADETATRKMRGECVARPHQVTTARGVVQRSRDDESCQPALEGTKCPPRALSGTIRRVRREAYQAA